MKPYAIVAALLTLMISLGAVPEIKEYRFEWKLIESENFSVSMIKTQDATSMMIYGRIDSLRLTPKEAEAIGVVLGQVDAMATKLKGDTDKSEVVKAGDYNVSFDYSAKYGFTAYIRDGKGIIRASVGLSQKQANDARAFMVQATALAAAVDKKVNP